MKVVLVQPPSYDWLTPCNGLALIQAHLKAAGITPAIVDSSMRVHRALARKLRRRFKTHPEYHEALNANPAFVAARLSKEVDEIVSHEPDVAAFAVLTYTEKWALDMAAALKRRAPRCRIVFGGPQCLRENNAFDHARNPSVDAVMLGEADVSFVKYVRALEKRGPKAVLKIRGVLTKDGDEIVDGGDEEGVSDMDALPFLDFSGFPMKDYSGDTIFINTTRSCVRRCRFCTHFMMQKYYGVMSPERTVSEIRHHLKVFPRRRKIIFSDSLVNGDVARLSKMADLLIDFRLESLYREGKASNFTWGGMAILHKTMTTELLRRLKASGCSMLSYGLESGSQKVIDAMDKRFRVSEAEDVIRETNKVGIRARLYLQCGFPGETEEDFKLTMGFVERNVKHIDQVSISFSEIYKGSPLDAQPKKFGIKTPIVDRTRWVSEDGANTYEVREDRCKRLSELSRRCGIETVEVFASKLGF